MRDYKIIAVDFDGTLCENKWPGIGPPNRKLIAYLKKRKKQGDKLILWTCRNGKMLTDAILWCSWFGLYFDAVNKNVPEIIELYGEDGRKVTADIYIDDHMGLFYKLPFKSKKHIFRTKGEMFYVCFR